MKRRIRAGKLSSRRNCRAPRQSWDGFICIVGEAENQSKRDTRATTAIANDEAPAEKPTAPKSFVFDAEGPPARFIWKVDAEGTLPKFRLNSATLSGKMQQMLLVDALRKWLMFSPSTPMAASVLLQQRDTWSGQEAVGSRRYKLARAGRTCSAPPVYSRDREFIGSRGFGLVRPDDAEQDPKQLVQSLQAEPQQSEKCTDYSRNAYGR